MIRLEVLTAARLAAAINRPMLRELRNGTYISNLDGQVFLEKQDHSGRGQIHHALVSNGHLLKRQADGGHPLSGHPQQRHAPNDGPANHKPHDRWERHLASVNDDLRGVVVPSLGTARRAEGQHLAEAIGTLAIERVDLRPDVASTRFWRHRPIGHLWVGVAKSGNIGNRLARVEIEILAKKRLQGAVRSDGAVYKSCVLAGRVSGDRENGFLVMDYLPHCNQPVDVAVVQHASPVSVVILMLGVKTKHTRWGQRLTS